VGRLTNAAAAAAGGGWGAWVYHVQRNPLRQARRCDHGSGARHGRPDLCVLRARAGRGAELTVGWLLPGICQGGTKIMDDEKIATVLPLVRAHPVTGRRCLNVTPRFMQCVEGMAVEESRELISQCMLPGTAPEHVYHLRVIIVTTAIRPLDCLRFTYVLRYRY
jgi:hypothetical protein